jgi:hypothetical protein
MVRYIEAVNALDRAIEWFSSLSWWLQILLVAVFLLYVVGPLVVWQTQKFSGRSTMYAVMPETLPGNVLKYFGMHSPQLAGRGFEVAAYLRDPQQSVEGFIALWVNRTSGQSAIVAMIVGMGALPMAKWIEFQTELADGTTVETNNTSNLGMFVLARNCHRQQFPGVSDAETMYVLHLWHESQWLNARAPRFLPAPGMEANYFAYDVLRSYQRQAAAGRMKEVEGGFKFTFIAAFRGTWMQCPPVLQIRKLRAWLRGNANKRRALASPARQPMAVTITDAHLVGAEI